MRKKGFTLIELLIVVAIIAILAAIAVPNFLEAQTRSRISRVKADMRSLASPIEQYKIDWNFYPSCRAYSQFGYIPAGGSLSDVSPMMEYIWGYTSITTPTAYITKLPFDPFGGTYAHLRYPGTPDRMEEWEKWYYYENRWAATAYWWRKNIDHGINFDRPGAPEAWTGRDGEDCWALHCDGPSQFWYYPHGAYGNFPTPDGGNGMDARSVPYDPSNGTKSLGSICRWGP